MGIQLSLFNLFRQGQRSNQVQSPEVKPRRPKPRRVRESSNGDLRAIWLKLRRIWFPRRPDIDSYTVVWSKRGQKRTLASCSTERKRICVARELNYPKYRAVLYPLLYHEMCHIYLGDAVSTKGGKMAWHGKEFKALERRYPQTAALDRWIKKGGWDSAVRSDRAIRAHRTRKRQAVNA
jgi:predicted metal-dependent hydrolase